MSRHAPYGGVGAVKRWCGNVRIYLTFNDATNQYECDLFRNGFVGEQFIGRPPSSRLAADSAQAFDDAARAAVAFAVDDGMIDDSDLDSDGSGYAIWRRK